jgi:hypothetical protein
MASSLASTAPVPTAIGVNAAVNPAVAATMSSTVSISLGSAAASSTLSLTKKTLKGGLILVFDSGEDGPNELCMEERRASLIRYQKLVNKAMMSAA